MSLWDSLVDAWCARHWVVIAAPAALAAGLIVYLVLGAGSEPGSGSPTVVVKTDTPAGGSFEAASRERADETADRADERQEPSRPQRDQSGRAHPHGSPQPVGDDAKPAEPEATAPDDGDESLSPDDQVALSEELSNGTAPAPDAEQPPNPHPNRHPGSIEPPPSHDHGEADLPVRTDHGEPDLPVSTDHGETEGPGAGSVPGASCQEGGIPDRYC